MKPTSVIPGLGARELEILHMCLESHGMELDVLVNTFWFQKEETDAHLFFKELNWSLRKLFLCGYIRFEYFAVWEEIHWREVLPLQAHFVFDDRIRWNKDRQGGWRGSYPLDFGQKLNAVITESGKAVITPKPINQ